eukprot:TRINITY_DN49115_c0_g1_i1.p1 TRINITY_DN49115_c0_g1~~TRINITY_DN49115_c0_g1_i1.p1  ORF type:complete len:521 (+),score=83.30 TRINITY_DN49115_c0_g1_i1:74-1564(+)
MPGVVFPKTEKGDRSTTAFNKKVFIGIVRSLGDSEFEQLIEREKDWRHKYPAHLDRLSELLVVSGLREPQSALSALSSGLASLREMEFETSGGEDVPFVQAMKTTSTNFETASIVGTGAVKADVKIPYKGKELSGAELSAQCDAWASYGCMEPSCAEAIKEGSNKCNTLRGRTFVVLGAGSELGPVRLLLEAGATVAAVGTRKPARWAELIEFTRRTAGTLLVPVASGSVTGGDDETIAQSAGVDLCGDAPAAAEWAIGCAKQATGLVTLGTYLYADGEANVRLTAVADYIADRIAEELGPSRASFAWLTSCSTTLVVPEASIEAQESIRVQRSNWWQKLFGSVQQCNKVVAEGVAEPPRMFRGLEVMQGPNYALAQMARQWRAMLLHSAGFTVSAPVTPMCRTLSVCHNKTMESILDGVAYIPPLEAFAPEAARAAMFAVLLTDLEESPPKLVTPFHLFERKSFHSGLWRCPFLMGSLGVPTYTLGRFFPRQMPA